MKILYRRGERADAGYLCRAANVWAKVEGCTPLTIPVGGMVVGTVECFLDQVSPTRLFDLLVPPDATIQRLPFEKIRADMLSFDFGLEANRFLARMIEATNACIIAKNRELSHCMRDYQLRSMIFTNILVQLESIWRETGAIELYAVMKKYEQSELLRDGTLLRRNQLISRMLVPSTPMQRFVQQFRKDSFICREGDKASAMFILLSGKVAVRSGERLIATIEEPGEAFGELSLILEGKRTATLTAETDTALYRVRTMELRQFHMNHGDVFACIARTLAQRVVANIDAIHEIVSRLQDHTDSRRGGPDAPFQRPYTGREELVDLIGELEAAKLRLRQPSLNKLCARLKKDPEVQKVTA